MDATILPRKRPRQERARATWDAILDATAEILRSHGYDGITTNKVADAAGVSVGSLYQYFPGKDALVIALLLRYAEAQRAVFFGAVNAVADAPIPDVIDAVIDALVAQEEADPQLAFVLMNQLPRVGEMGKVVAYTEEMLTAPLEAFFAARRAELADLDPGAAALLLTHAVPPLLQRMRLRRPPPAERRAVFRELRRMLLGYLSPPKAIGPAESARRKA